MSYITTSTSSDVDTVLKLAHNVAAECSGNPEEFNIAQNAASALITELNKYIYLRPTQSSYQRADSSLISMLSLPSHALYNLLRIRREFKPEKRALSLASRTKWKMSHRSDFEGYAGQLFQATTPVREMVGVLEAQKSASKSGGGGKGSGTGTQYPRSTSVAGGSSSSRPIGDCFSGTNCRKEGCIYKHPRAAAAAPVPSGSGAGKSNKCYRGVGCKLPGCIYDHPQGEACNFGKDCFRNQCFRSHPRPEHCPQGAGCPNRRACAFGHPWPPPKGEPGGAPPRYENSRGGSGGGGGGGKYGKMTEVIVKTTYPVYQ